MFSALGNLLPREAAECNILSLCGRAVMAGEDLAIFLPV
jgi:hypothetical protein